MNAPIFNRNQPTSLTGPTWHQIEVTGEHPTLLSDGAEVTQMIDAVALDSIIHNFDLLAAAPGFPGLLVDRDHLSHDPANDTEAMAWLKDLRLNHSGQLEGLLDWTDEGGAAVLNKRYKFFSTEYGVGGWKDLGNGRVRPLVLTGLALTNRPNNKGGKPIYNREGEALDPSTKTDMKTIAEKLGLSAEATEEEILDAIASLPTPADEAAEMMADSEVEEILNRNSKRLADGTRESWKTGLLANRETTLALLEKQPEVKDAAPPQGGREPITNRAKTSTPDPGRANGREKGDEQAALVRSIKNRDKCSHTEAWTTAKLEKPALFQND